YAGGTSEFGANDLSPIQSQTPISACVAFCGDGSVDQPSETCDTGPTSLMPNNTGCPTQGTTCQCPTCVGNPSLDSNTCRAPGTTDQCTICGDGVIQIPSNETCDGTVYSGVCADGTTRCSTGNVAQVCAAGDTCNGFCSNSDPANPTACTPANVATACHTA